MHNKNKTIEEIIAELSDEELNIVVTKFLKFAEDMEKFESEIIRIREKTTKLLN